VIEGLECVAGKRCVDNFRAAHGKLESEYGLAITSLFKTVADIRRDSRGRNLFPVITLRDDIFDFLRHAERNRWQQHKVEIEWDDDKIKEMIAYRLAVTAEREPVPFEEVWPKLVGQEAARIGAKVPDISQIFEAVLDGPHRSVGRKELQARYSAYLQNGSSESAGMRPAAMMEKLYQFGVIGYAETKGPAKGEKFRYNGGGQKLHPTAGLLIHKGLIRAKDEDSVLFDEEG
jgi:hypothetical protein